MDWFFSAGRVQRFVLELLAALLQLELRQMAGVLGICRIHEKESAVVCPVIDVIDWNTFEYLGNSGEPQIGGFDWRLVFTWHVVPQRERELMRSPIDVIRSAFPAHLRAHPKGGLAVDFWSLPMVSPECFSY